MTSSVLAVNNKIFSFCCFVRKHSDTPIRKCGQQERKAGQTLATEK